MFLFFFFLLLLNIPKEIFGIYCIYSEESKSWPLDNFNSSQFEMEIDNFPNYDYKDDNIDMCRVEIFVDYQSREFIISFADSFEWSQLDDGEGRLDFLIMFNQDSEPSLYNVLEYACYDQNNCDKLFLFYHVDWLRYANYTTFQEHLSSLLLNKSNEKNSCFTNRINVLNCSSGVCAGKYYKNYRNYLFECLEYSDTSIEVHITTNLIIERNILNKINFEESQIIRYTCKFNECNNQVFTDSVVKIVEIYFCLQPMKDALIKLYQPYDSQNFNLTDQSTFSTLTKQFSSSKGTIPDYISNIAKKSFYISINLFFILLFILFDI